MRGNKGEETRRGRDQEEDDDDDDDEREEDVDGIRRSQVGQVDRLESLM